MMAGLLRALGRSTRYFSSQIKIKEAQDIFGINSKQALDAHMAYAMNLISEKKLADAKENFTKALEISKTVNRSNTQESSLLIQKIAKTYETIGDLENSIQYYIQAYNIDLKHLPSDHEDLLFFANRIGAMYADISDLQNANIYLNNILTKVESSNNEELKAAFFGNLGHVKMRLGDRDNSLKYFLLAKSYQERVNPLDEMMIKYLQSLGMCYWVQSQYEIAKENFTQALEMLQAKPEENCLQIVDIYGHLAYLHNDMKLEKEMHNYFDKAYQTFLTSNIEKKNEKIAQYLGNIADTMKSVGDAQNTRLYLQRLLDFCIETFGEVSRQTADAYQQFSGFFLTQQNLDECLKYAEKCLNSRKQLPNNHYDLLYSYNQYASIYHTIGDLDTAYKYLTESTEILNKYPNRRLHTSHYHNLALLYRDQKKYIEAENAMRKHIEGIKAEFGESHPALAAGYSGLGHIFRVSKNYDKSLESYHKALSISDDTLGREHITTADYLEYIGEIHRMKKNFKEALAFHTEDLNIRLKLLGPNHFSIHLAYYNLAMTYYDMNDLINAADCCLKRLELFTAIYGHDHTYVAGCYAFLGEIHLKGNDKKQAIDNLQRAKSILSSLNNLEAAQGLEKKIGDIQKS